MNWSDLPLNPTNRVLRQFASLWVLFVGAVAIRHWLVVGQDQTATALGVLAIVVGAVGLAFPRAVKPIFVGWLILSFPIGWLVSRVALVVLFIGVLTPIGLLLRISGRDPLRLRRRHDRDTYWIPKESTTDSGSYLRQF